MNNTAKAESELKSLPEFFCGAPYFVSWLSKFNKAVGLKSIALYDDQEGDFSSPREKLNKNMPKYLISFIKMRPMAV